jgi:transcriptional regulator with XRE-family HTH domain
MRTGTIQIHHRNRLHPRLKGPSVRSRSLAPANIKRAASTLHLAPAEVRETARNLRELLLWDLKEEGYTFREIGELFGMSRQRASQIERKLIRRASSRALTKSSESPWPIATAISKVPAVWIRTITREEFEERLSSINRSFQEQFSRLIERGYKRRRLPDPARAGGAASEFWKVWPLIEAYGRRPFTFSKLVGDFPQLRNLPHLAQLLGRLRRTGLLRKVGMVSVKGHNHPEILMAEAPVEQHVAAAIERLVAQWSESLHRLQMVRRPSRPSRSIEMTRRWLVEKLLGEGISAREIEEVFGVHGADAEPAQHRSI